MTLINVLIYTAFIDSLCLLFVALACLVVACFRGHKSRLWDAAFFCGLGSNVFIVVIEILKAVE
jgi:hypothetical protein